MSIWEYANPRKFMQTTAPLAPWFLGLGLLGLSVALIWGVWFTPEDYRQGAAVKIIYIHVPSAFLAINIWFMMLVTSIIWFIRRHHVSALAAKSAAPIGMAMTAIALITGAIWGQPIWGTWWAWEPRLTAFLVLFLFYMGYIALWSAIEDPDTAADLTSVLCMVGTVFAILSRYAVFFSAQGLHQGSSLSLDKEEHVADVFYYPLLLSMGAFVFIFIGLLFIRTNTEIRLRRIRALQIRGAA